ncbi:putative tail fiber [Shigella phage vB_SboD_StarDew]|uniref:Tail fiber n=1 Tax=Shigella phage vB_SboD_StarDew TaxID=2902747 RepID=A0AAE9CBB2_9CAUD|nr:putative tail fiber [Shigella phage vB_SboD_StarDew]UGO46637.1 putative tail fiber [Shigella phage vB_SboD_StarDew]
MAAGTLSVTNNSKAVVGVGTTFTAFKAGDFLTLVVGQVPYTVAIASVESATALTLVLPFDGPTATGLAWDGVKRDTMSLATMGVTVQAQKALRLMIADENNWRAIFGDAEEITVTLPNGQVMQGMSWGYLSSLLKEVDPVEMRNLQQQAETAKNQAVTAKGQAESARDAANTAKTGAETARDQANNAKTDAQTAKGQAESARDAANTAKTGAENARNQAQGYRDEAEGFKNQINPSQFMQKSQNLNDVADKAKARTNLALNRFNQPRADLTEVYSNDDRTGYKLIVKDNGDWGAMKHDGSANMALSIGFGGTGGKTGAEARASLNVFKRDRTSLGERDLDTIDGSGDGPGVYFQASSAAATSARHYPEATAGMLEVFQHGANGESGAIQRYTPFTILAIAPEGSQEYARAGKGTFYVRSKNGNAPKWSPWLPFQTGLYGGVVSYPGTQERSSWTDYVNVLAQQPSSMGTYNIRSVGWVNAISSRHLNGTGDGSNYGVVFEDGQMAATHYKNVTVRKQVAGNWINPVTLWHTGNTTVDSNGFVKRASPIVKVFGTGDFETNDESEGCKVEKVGVGEYLITGCMALNADLAWGGVRGGIEVPRDINGQPILWVDYEVNADGSLLLKTFHREHHDAPVFARNTVPGYSNGDPIDIPNDVFVSVRVDMPEDSIYNVREREMRAIAEVELATGVR